MKAPTLCLVFSLLAASPTFAQTTAFVGGRIIDGTGKTVENGTVIVRDGKIAQVGPAASTSVPSGATRVDLKGLTLIPGLINAHGHLTNVIGVTPDDVKGNSRDNLLRQLKTYAQYGITTLFSLGEDENAVQAALQLRAEQAKGAIDVARLFLSGPVIGGATADAARAATDRVVSLKPDLLKIRIDDNLGTARKMPDDAYRVTVARANELKLPMAAHIYYLADAKAVLAAGADMIAHSVRDVPVDAEFVAAMKARGACYSPTLMREVSTFVYESTPAWANDPFFVKSVDSAVTAELTSAERQAKFRASTAYKQGLQYKANLETAKRNLKTLSDQGVQIAMGTDTGPARRFQGFFEHLELEMMVDAGLTPMQALVAATGDAAKCYRKGGQLGTIERGAAADFVVLTANPLQDITNTRRIQSVWINGQKLF